MKGIEKEIYSKFADIATSMGYSEIHGRVLAALLVEGNPLSLQELAIKTGYSASTISLSLDLLELLGMIKKIKKVGDRRLYIELKCSLLEGLKRAFLTKIQKNISESLFQFGLYKKKLKKSKDKKVLRTLNILEKEIKKLDKYVSLLAKLKLR